MAKTHVLERTQQVERPLDEVFAFFAEAENMEALTPPFLRFRIVTPLPIEMREGAPIEYALSLYGVPIRWRTRITEWRPGIRFVDEQESGPYAFWRHTHEFTPQNGSTLVRDRVEYRLPFGLLGRAVHALFVKHSLARIFDYRRAAIRRALEEDRLTGPPSPAYP